MLDRSDSNTTPVISKSTSYSLPSRAEVVGALQQRSADNLKPVPAPAAFFADEGLYGFARRQLGVVNDGWTIFPTCTTESNLAAAEASESSIGLSPPERFTLYRPPY